MDDGDHAWVMTARLSFKNGHHKLLFRAALEVTLSLNVFIFLCFHVSVPFLFSCVRTGQYWSELVSTGQDWSVLVGTALHWSEPVSTGQDGSGLVRTSQD